ncbi:MAG TPA: AmmeMemoRadiSam system protein B [Candidatus Binataceae bacterium]|nr:AmmeMemoRadiSam system protein B [Candidatus Binataceae bacterium]
MIEKPRIRALEAFPVEQQEQTYICLRDPTGLAPEPILLGMGAYFIVTLFDGNSELRDIQGGFLRRFGENLPLDKLNDLIATLDRGYFLDSPKFAERMNRVREDFRASPERSAIHAGACYAKDPAELTKEIEGFFAPPEGPGAANPQRQAGELAGLIAPHIDPRRGAAAYAHAYGQLKAFEAPELVIILGTSHYGGGPELFSATRKNYATPFGAVKTDQNFIDRLATRYRGGDLFADELLHRNEHSIEFQALFLKWVLGNRNFTVVPILVSSFHEMVAMGSQPVNDSRVASFIDALGDELAQENRRALIVAGVDFAHVGRKFGDEFSVDESIAQRVKREDMALIEFIKRGDAGGFFADIAKDRDARRICGLAPMYTQLELLRGHRGRLLKYGIAMEPQTGSAVSFASLAID